MLAPVDPYVPACGAKRSIALKGPMREPYVRMLTETLKREGFFHVQIGNMIFLKLINPESYFRQAPLFGDIHNLLINTEWRIAMNIARGTVLDNVNHPPPDILIAAIEQAKVNYDSLGGVDENFFLKGIGPVFAFDCEVFRAAALKVEDMGEGELDHFELKIPLPERCHLIMIRSWSQKCGRLIPAERRRSSFMKDIMQGTNKQSFPM